MINVIIYIIGLMFVWMLQPMLGCIVITILPIAEVKAFIEKENKGNCIIFFLKRLLTHYAIFALCIIISVLATLLLLSISM